MSEFVSPDTFADELASPGVAIKAVRFELDAFDSSLYRQANIAMPGKLQKSVAKRQAEFLAGRLCAESALQQLGFEQIPVGVGENRLPIWPQGAIGSISHTAGRALAAVGNAKRFSGMGIDCETLVRPDVLERVYSAIVMDPETDFLENSRWRKDQFFTLVFSAKESLYKALFPMVGRYFGFDKAEVFYLQDGDFKIRLTDDLNNQWRNGQVFEGRYLLGGEFVVTLLVVE